MPFEVLNRQITQVNYTRVVTQDQLSSYVSSIGVTVITFSMKQLQTTSELRWEAGVPYTNHASFVFFIRALSIFSVCFSNESYHVSSLLRFAPELRKTPLEILSNSVCCSPSSVSIFTVSVFCK